MRVANGMRASFWGVRGSLPAPQQAMLGVGGNTPCVEVELSDAHLVLDAGSGIRVLGERLAVTDRKPIHILLTHLHLDHIQGLLFFLPLFQPGREVVIWGPHSRREPLRGRLARYLSAPLSPVEIRDLPAAVTFQECGPGAWDIAGASVRGAPVLHRGLTLGYRIEYRGAALAYVPDHEPRLSGSLEDGDPRWLSGADLVTGVDLLIHDAQYTDEQYGVTRGWGHSAINDAVRFAARVGVPSLRLFHHDPTHDDEKLGRLAAASREWARDDMEVDLAREGDVVELGGDGL